MTNEQRLTINRNCVSQAALHASPYFDPPISTYRTGLAGKAVIIVKKAVRKLVRFIIKPQMDKNFQFQVNVIEALKLMTHSKDIPPAQACTWIIHKDHMVAMPRKRNETLCTDIRNSQLELMAYEINDRKINGSVAELGVFNGDFAKNINAVFPERKLYLFDTFEGFHDNDIEIEKEQNFSDASQDFSVQSVEAVLSKMPVPELCIIKKGWFPDTAEGVDESFAFVHLDADLYKPIYAGLAFFWPKLSYGGYIMVHDYNSSHYKGARAAVRDFCSEFNISYVPLCDAYGSVVLTK